MELKKRKNRILILLLVMTFVSVTNALPSGALPGWSGNLPFDYLGADGRTLTGRIDYAVYDVLNYPGTAPSDGDYVYAYEIFNMMSSDVCIESFSVCILDNASVKDIYVDPSTHGIEPFAEYFSPNAHLPQNASFLFLPAPSGELIDNGQHSDYLLFSSDNRPTLGFGIIEGGAIGGMTGELPTPMPIPEPITIVLLGAGGLTGFIRRRRPV